MRQFSLLTLLVLFVSCQVSKNTKQNSKELKEPMFTVNNTKVYPDEFIYAYKKSAKNKGEREPVEEYLDLYINFKLKVEDAKKAGIDTLPSYQNELAGYLKDVKKPYLVTEKVNEALLEETYNRLQQEINASHILVRFDENPSPEDTLKAYQKIEEIRQKYLAGQSFTKLAEEYSEDPSAKQNQGNLGWFTAFQMVYPFESAAFNTPKDSISDIVRTRFGYHLIKVNDKRETSGRIKISHILLRFPPNGTTADSLAVKKRIYEIHGELMEGEPWFAAATKYSEDLNTKDNGGSLPWFSIGSLPKEMEDAAFKLSQPDQISSPVKSPFGWHIIKLEEKRGIGSMENMRESLVRRIQRDQRSALKVSEIIEKLKKENNFQKNEGVYVQLRSQESYEEANIPENLKPQTIFTINGEVHTVQEFLDSQKRIRNFETAIKAFEEKAILDYEDEHLADKYPEYRLLASEYRDGLLLFEIMSRKVWDKISTDTVGMKSYYTNNKNDYYSAPKIKADVFLLADTSNVTSLKEIVSDSLYALTESLNFETLSKKELSYLKGYTTPVYAKLTIPNGKDEKTLTNIVEQLKDFSKYIIPMEPSYSDKKAVYLQLFCPASDILSEEYESILQVENGMFEVANLLGNEASVEAGESILKEDENQFQLINVYQFFDAKPLSYKEAKSELINDYQEYLEREWIKQLKAENSVVVNQAVLKKVKNQIEE